MFSQHGLHFFLREKRTFLEGLEKCLLTEPKRRPWRQQRSGPEMSCRRWWACLMLAGTRGRKRRRLDIVADLAVFMIFWGYLSLSPSHSYKPSGTVNWKSHLKPHQFHSFWKSYSSWNFSNFQKLTQQCLIVPHGPHLQLFHVAYFCLQLTHSLLLISPSRIHINGKESVRSLTFPDAL